MTKKNCWTLATVSLFLFSLARCQGSENVQATNPTPGATISGTITRSIGDGGGTIVLKVSEKGDSLSQIDVTVRDSSAECKNGSEGTLNFGAAELPFPGPFEVASGKIDARLIEDGRLEGVFQSPSEASGTIHLVGKVTLMGSLHTCDFGDWNWKAKPNT